MTEASFRFRILEGLPAFGPSAVQFTSGSKRTDSEGLVVEIEPRDGSPWVGNFQPGGSSYSAVMVHPNPRYLVVVAGGAGYVVSPDDRALIATFGAGAIRAAWPMPSLNLFVFENGTSFASIGTEGPAWNTRRISWDGFRGIDVAEKTIYGLAWNAVLQQWQPFSIQATTGRVRGGAYSEAQQQQIAIAREITLRGGGPVHPLIKRAIELAIGLLAIALVVLSVYLVVDSADKGELTWAGIRDNLGVAYVCLALVSTSAVLAIRILFPSVAPKGRLISKNGILAFFGVFFAMHFIMWYHTRDVPVALLAMIGTPAAILAINKWFK